MQEGEISLGSLTPLDYSQNGSTFPPNLSNPKPPPLTTGQSELLSSLHLSSGGNFGSLESGISPSYSREELSSISTSNSFPGYDGGLNKLAGGMEMDVNYSNQSSGSTNSNSSRAGFHYPATNSIAQPHPTVLRHHPYAHPAHVRPVPPSLAHTVSASVLPPYFATGPSSSASAEAPSLSPSNSMNFPQTAPVPHRVHSAPSHTLTLSSPTKTDALNRLHAMSPVEHEIPIRYDGMTGMEDGMGGGAGYEPNWEPVSNDQNWNGNSERDRTIIERPSSAATIKIEDPKLHSLSNGNGYFDATAFLPLQTPIYPAPSSLASVPSTYSTASSNYDAAVPAITLLRNRLPILEAALSISESAPGDDEEEIWKGVTGAFDELKRVIMGRMEARRDFQSQGKRSFAVMEMESPPGSDRGLSATKYLSQVIHPPLIHSQSTPDVPLSAQANVARAQAQLQASQMQLQQAQIQQAQLQQAQALIEVEQRARAELELRAGHEAENRARLEAEARVRLEVENRRVEEETRIKLEMEQEQYQQQVRLQQAHLLLAQQQQLQQQQALQQQALQQQQAQALAQAQVQSESNLALQHLQQLEYAREVVNTAQVHQLPPAPARYASPPAYSYPPSPSPITTNHVLHSSHTPSPLSAGLPPRQVSATLMSMSNSLPVTPVTSMINRDDGMSMGAVMQMHRREVYGDEMEGLENGLHGVEPLPVERVIDGWNNGVGPNELDGLLSNAIHQFLPTATLSPPSAAGLSLTSPPSASSSSRPSRSRAASGSGYVSTTGSRSRAASGSGFQLMLDTRSRAVSSASSAWNGYEKEELNLGGGGGGGDEEDVDELESEMENNISEIKNGGSGIKMSISQIGGNNSGGVDLELSEALDPIFLDYLAEICSDLDATDSKGELIHQTLMAKKMEKLDASGDFRPFKFRIQAFTTAFSEKIHSTPRITAQGTEEFLEVPLKKIRQYLWSQPFISRFNDDGKKSKSKGNHIWTIEAKKLNTGWEFREFFRCIKGIPVPFAYVGVEWSWSPRIWDPQASVLGIDPGFSSSNLPHWLEWQENVLSGMPTEENYGDSHEITARATFNLAGKEIDIASSFNLSVVYRGEEEINTRMEESIQIISPPIKLSPPSLDLPVFIPLSQQPSTSSLLPSLLPALTLLNFESTAPSPRLQQSFQNHPHLQSPHQMINLQSQLDLNGNVDHLQQQQYPILNNQNQNMQLDFIGVPQPVDLVQALNNANFARRNLMGSGYAEMGYVEESLKNDFENENLMR